MEHRIPEGDQDVLAKIVELLHEQARVKRSDIALSSELEDDLGITGDDAVDFMQEYFNAFGLSPKGFEIDDYFAPESGCLFALFTESESQPVTVAHLVRCAKLGHWVRPQGGT